MPSRDRGSSGNLAGSRGCLWSGSAGKGQLRTSVTIIKYFSNDLMLNLLRHCQQNAKPITDITSDDNLTIIYERRTKRQGVINRPT